MSSTFNQDYSSNIGQHSLSVGYSCWVRIGSGPSDCEKIGMVDSMRATKNMQLQRAQVCGAIMPASIDPQSFTVNLNLSGFMPVPGLLDSDTTINGAKGAKYTLQSFNPDSDDFIKGEVATKFDYMEFYDESTDTVLAGFYNVIPSSFGITVNGGSYVKADIACEALYMTSGTDYEDQA